MSDPYNEDFEYISDPEDEQKLKIALANCILAWSLIEMSLSSLFSYLVDSRPSLSLIIWDSVISFDAKMKCLTAVAKETVKDEKSLAVFSKLSKKNISAVRIRNKIAHSGMIGGKRKGKSMAFLAPYLSIPYLMSKQKEKLSADDLVNICKNFEELEKANRWFCKSIIPDFLEEHPEPPPDLICQIQKSIGQIPEE